MQAKKKFLIQSTAFALFLAVVGYFAGPGISQSIQQPAHVLGSFATNDCAKVNAAGFIVSNGSACGAAAGTVTTGVTLTTDLPVIGAGGSAVAIGTRSGNTTQYVTTTGAQTSGDCVSIDANGNHVANGSACGSGSSGGLTLISENILGSDTATVTFSSIAGTYKNLRLTMQGRTSTAATVPEDIYLQLNGDSGANYNRQYILGFNTTVAVAATSAATSFVFGNFPGNSATAGRSGVNTIFIPGYARTVFQKILINTYTDFGSTVGAESQAGTIGGLWANTAAITSIVVGVSSGANFKTGSYFQLWGEQ